jgi:hypothetical protein
VVSHQTAKVVYYKTSRQSQGVTEKNTTNRDKESRSFPGFKQHTMHLAERHYRNNRQTKIVHGQYGIEEISATLKKDEITRQ